MEVHMKTINSNDIGMYLFAALDGKKKNILFVSATLEYKGVLEWLNARSEYRVVRFVEPQALYEEKNGLLVKNDNCCVIADEKLKALNNESSILFCNIFSQSCIQNFEGYLDILKGRFYVNKFPNGDHIKHSVDKMALFIAFTTPHKPNDYAALDKKYYELFDEVYLLT